MNDSHSEEVNAVAAAISDTLLEIVAAGRASPEACFEGATKAACVVMLEAQRANPATLARHFGDFAEALLDMQGKKEAGGDRRVI